MPDVTGVAAGAVEQPAVAHDAAPDSGRHDHADEVAFAGGGADPALAERERLGVVVDPHRQRAVLCETRAQRKVAPRRDVERRYLFAAETHRPAAPDADRDRTVGR